MPASRRRLWLPSIITTLVTLYAPFSWLLWIDYPWTSYRFYWLKLWPLLPGFFPGAVLLHARVPDSVEFASWGLGTAVLIVALSYLGSRGPRRLLLSALIALAISIPSALSAYSLFRA